MFLLLLLLGVGILLFFILRFLYSLFFDNFFLRPTPTKKNVPLDGPRSLPFTEFPPEHDTEYDAIVIGSGMSGLSFASFLLQMDPSKRLLVLDQNDQIGGMLHTFEVESFSFSSGLHFLIMGSPFASLLGTVGGQNGVRLKKLGSAVDEVFFLGNGDSSSPWVVPHGWKESQEAMRAIVSEECEDSSEEAILLEQIELFWKDLVRSTEDAAMMLIFRFYVPACLRRIAIWLAEKILGVGIFRLNRMLFADYLRMRFPGNDPLSQKLRSHFSRWTGIVGRLTETAAAPTMVAAASTLAAKLYPVGGSDALVESITSVIRNLGGELYHLAEVKRILLNDENVAYGVEMANGVELHAKSVVSCCGIANTFGSLLPKRVRPRRFEEFSRGSLHFVAAFLGFDCPSEELGIPNGDFWLLRQDFEQSMSDLLAAESPKSYPDVPPMVYIGNPNSVHPQPLHGKSGVTLLMVTRPEHFSKWEDFRIEQRGSEYGEMKRASLEAGLKAFFDLFPRAEEHLEIESLSSTLSTKHWTGWPEGEVYGALATPSRLFEMYDECIATTGGVRGGLVLCGTDSMTGGGILNALLAGLVSAADVHGGLLLKTKILLQSQWAHASLHRKVVIQDEK